MMMMLLHQCGSCSLFRIGCHGFLWQNKRHLHRRGASFVASKWPFTTATTAGPLAVPTPLRVSTPPVQNTKEYRVKSRGELALEAPSSATRSSASTTPSNGTNVNASSPGPSSSHLTSPTRKEALTAGARGVTTMIGGCARRTAVPSASSAFPLGVVFRPTRVGLKAKVIAFNPWKARPGGLHSRHSRPQMVHPRHFQSAAYRRVNPDDPTRLLPPSHVLVKRCAVCGRTQFVPLEERHFFHTCCEGEAVMKPLTDMRSVMRQEHRLLQTVRQWDVESERPWSNPHRPKPKGRSKLKKR